MRLIVVHILILNGKDKVIHVGQMLVLTKRNILNILLKNIQQIKKLNNMKKLNDYQKDFICDKFFTNEKYPGWKSIAMDLLNNGECVVAGNYCIWKGGIGNFIKVETASKYIGCVKYVF